MANIGKQRILNLLLDEPQAYAAVKTMNHSARKAAILKRSFGRFRDGVKTNNVDAVNEVYGFLRHYCDYHIEKAGGKDGK